MHNTDGLRERGRSPQRSQRAAARLIVACVRESEARSNAALDAAAQQIEDWTPVIGLAERHRVAPFLLRCGSERGFLPADAVRRLREGTFASAAHLLLLEDCLRAVVEQLARAEVPVIVLKGPVLARALYDDPLQRQYSDLDVVVPESKEGAAVACLLAGGFVERVIGGHHHGEAGGSDGARSRYHRRFFSEERQVLVELHLDPLQIGLEPRCEAGRWRRSLPFDAFDPGRALGWEDTLVQLCVHVHKHGFARLIWLKDIDLLLRHRTDLDWQLVRAVARAEGVEASVWYALELVRMTLATPVPGRDVRTLAPAPQMRWLYRMVWPPAGVVALDGRMRRRAVQFCEADSWRGMLPSLVFMGRRRERLAGIGSALRQRYLRRPRLVRTDPAVQQAPHRSEQLESTTAG